MTTKNKLEKGRISVLQLVFLNITFIISTADVFLPALVAQEAEQDSWLAVILGTLTALTYTVLMLALTMKYPDKTIIEYSCTILGKPLGKLVGLLYVYFFFYVAHVVTRELGEIFVISFIPDSPIAVYSIVTVAVSAYAVYKGLEVIARVNDILLPVGIAVLIFIGVINIPKMNFSYFLPVLYHGLYPVVKGGILIQTWLLEVFIVLQLVPFVREKQRVKKGIMSSIALLGMNLQIGVFTIAVFGPLTSNFLLPALIFVKYASIGQYINNLDISILVVWVSGIFIKIVLSYYICVLALSQLFELKSLKPMIIPVGILIICISIAAAPDITTMLHSMHYILPFYMLTMTVIIPAVLLIIAVIKDKVADAATQKADTVESGQ
ncbi:MAG: GerAB/ArcD/ProY family transporter [Bacillota bacterium]